MWTSVPAASSTVARIDAPHADCYWQFMEAIAVQVHGALCYSNDSPLSRMLTQARWVRFADGADEIHPMRIAQLLIQAHAEPRSTRRATGDLPL